MEGSWKLLTAAVSTSVWILRGGNPAPSSPKAQIGRQKQAFKDKDRNLGQAKGAGGLVK